MFTSPINALSLRNGDRKEEAEHVKQLTQLVSHYPEDRQKGFPGWNAHHHKINATPFHSPVFGANCWYQMGCGHKRGATYTDGEKWMNGFIYAHVDTQRRSSQIHAIDVRDFCEVGGTFYERMPEESVEIRDSAVEQRFRKSA